MLLCSRSIHDKSIHASRLIKEFEREARTDGIAPTELANRKKAMVQELNDFIGMKKERSADLEARRELVAGGSPSKAPQAINGGHSIDSSHRDMQWTLE